MIKIFSTLALITIFFMWGYELIAQDKITVDVNMILSDFTTKGIGIGSSVYDTVGDHNYKVRNTVSTLTDIGTKSYRFPGLYGAAYRWSVPPYTMPDPHLGIIAKSSVGGITRDPYYVEIATQKIINMGPGRDINYFLTTCKQAYAEPFIIIPIDAANNPKMAEFHISEEEVIRDAEEEVRYCNSIKGYHVKYWEIGNESDISKGEGAGQVWRASDYVTFFNKIAIRMKAIDPTIKIGMVAGFDCESWMNPVLKNIQENVDFIAVHTYNLAEYKYYQYYATKYDDYTVGTDIIKCADQAIESLSNSINKKRINIQVTETSAYQPNIFKDTRNKNNMGNAVRHFDLLGNIFQTDRVQHVNVWTSRWGYHDRMPQDDDDNDNATSQFKPDNTLFPMGMAQSILAKNILKKRVAVKREGSMRIRAYSFYDTASHQINVFLANKDIPDMIM